MTEGDSGQPVMPVVYYGEGWGTRPVAANQLSVGAGLTRSIVLAAIMALGTLYLCAFWSKSVFGFPVPFTQVLGGMPGYFGTFVVTIGMVVATAKNVTKHKSMVRPMLQIYLVLHVILQVSCRCCCM